MYAVHHSGCKNTANGVAKGIPSSQLQKDSKGAHHLAARGLTQPHKNHIKTVVIGGRSGAVTHPVRWLVMVWGCDEVQGLSRSKASAALTFARARLHAIAGE
jgi:hypothetical protein